MGRLALVLSMFFWMTNCSPKLQEVWIKDQAALDSLGIMITAVGEGVFSPCDQPLNYVADIGDSLRFQKRTLKLVFHIMNSENGSYNFNEDEGWKFMWYLVNEAKDHLHNNAKMNLPVDNDTPVLPPGYTYTVNLNPQNIGKSIYHHYDDDAYYFIHKGRDRNNFRTDVIKSYAVQEDSFLNVFVMPHHPDSVASKSYHVTSTGIALDNSIKIAGLYETEGEPWQFASLLNHEIGHVLGLNHSWLQRDGCDDTPPHANCYGTTGAVPCEGAVSNNMMDYNNSQRALTPCQIGIIHRNLSRTYSRQRGLLVRNWCEKDSSASIIVSEVEQWLGNKDLKNDIIIQAEGELHMYCRTSFPAGATITVAPGGKLYLHDAILHSDCGGSWNGIRLQEKKNEKGELYISEKSKILDIKVSNL